MDEREKAKEEFFKSSGARIKSFQVLRHAITETGASFDKIEYGYNHDDMPNFGYLPAINVVFPYDFTEVIVTLTVPLIIRHKVTQERSPELAVIQTKTTYEIIGATKFARDPKMGIPEIVLKVMIADALSTTRGAFSVKNAGTPLSEAVIPMSDALVSAELDVTDIPAQPNPRSEFNSEVEVLFDVYEYETELMPGHTAHPTYGIEAINHKAHTIRVTDHYLEILENGSWKKFERALFDDRSEEHEFEKGGKRYVEYPRKLPKLLKPNTRFLWRIHSIHLDKDAKIRGVIVADWKAYYSEPFEFISPKPLADSEQIQLRKERLQRQ